MNTQLHGFADLHLHTHAGSGRATIHELLQHISNHTQLDVIAITDYNCVDSALWALEHKGDYAFDIVPGIEVKSTDGHVLGLWVTELIPQNLNLKETIAAIHEQGGLAVLAHPFHFHFGVVAKNFWRYLRQPDLLLEAGLDAIEVHNSGIVIPGQNSLARALGHLLDIPVIGSSDARSLNTVGAGFTRFLGETANDLREALETNRTIAGGNRWPILEYMANLRKHLG